MFSSIVGALSGALEFVNKIMDFITAEQLKKAGMQEQQLANEKLKNKMHEAADDARKNKPSGNIIDHF